jgi:hypothetical protein
LNFVGTNDALHEDCAHGEAPPAQRGTSPVPRGEPVTAGKTVTDK